MKNTYRLELGLLALAIALVMAGCGDSNPTGRGGDTGQFLLGAVWDRAASYRLHDVVRGPTFYLAVGDSGYAVGSNDGIQWSGGNQKGFPNFTSVSYCNNYFYVLADNGNIYRSGLQIGFMQIGNTAYPDARFVKRTPDPVIVLPGQPFFLRSRDSFTFQPETVDLDGTISDLAVKDSIWVAVLSTGIYRSIYGSGWNRVDTTSGLTYIESSDSIFIVFGRANLIYRSYDGVHWVRSAEVDHPGLTAQDPQFAGGQFYSFEGPNICASHDGYTWSVVNFGRFWPPFSAAGLGSTAVTVWLNGDVFTNTSGDWDTCSTGTMIYPLNHLFKWKDNYYTLGQSVWGMSQTGRNWRFKYVSDAATDGYTFGYSTSSQLLFYRNNTVDVSTDGVSFTNEVTNISDIYEMTTVHDTLYATVASTDLPKNGVYWSTNGTAWFKAFPYSGRPFTQIAYGNQAIVASDSRSDIYVSRPGHPWATDTTLSFFVNSITFDGHQFVAAGLGGGVAASPDGSTWQLIAPGLSANILKLVNTGFAYVAITDNKEVYTYDAGQGWVLRYSGDNYLYDLYTDGTRLIATGENGEILFSWDKIDIGI